MAHVKRGVTTKARHKKVLRPQQKTWGQPTGELFLDNKPGFSCSTSLQSFPYQITTNTILETHSMKQPKHCAFFSNRKTIIPPQN